MVKVRENRSFVIFILAQLAIPFFVWNVAVPLLYTATSRADLSLGIVAIISIVIPILLYIYKIIWWNSYFTDLNIVCRYVEDHDLDMAPSLVVYIILSLITCGVYTWYWMYKQGNRMQIAAEKYGFRINEKGSSYLLWNIFGGILTWWIGNVGSTISWCLMTGALNKLAHYYNVKIESDSKPINKPLPITGPDVGSIPIGIAGEPTVVSNHSVIFNKGEYAGQSIELKDGETLSIGRKANQANLLIHDEKVSGLHLTIRWSNLAKKFYVKDFSSNGTYYANGTRLPKETEVELNPGTVLSLADGKNEIILK